MPTKTGVTNEQYTEIKDWMEKLSKGQEDIRLSLSSRQYIDDEVLKQKELLAGNGKLGFKQVRDKVAGWETKLNLLIVGIAGDIIFRLVQLAIGS